MMDGERLGKLLEALRDGDAGVRLEAARALGEMGSAAATPEVLRALVGRLRDRSETSGVRAQAAWALKRMGPSAAVPEVLEALRACLGDGDDWVGYVAAWTLEALVRAARAAAPPRNPERGATLMEVLVALAVLAVAIGAVATGLAAWHGQYRRTVGAWRCREVLETARVQARTAQVVCGRDLREYVRSACRAEVAPEVDCRAVGVYMRLGGSVLRRTYHGSVPVETYR
jgi:prepilin-type N-terminal cleavage/methylation domain-containing protein